MLFSKVCIVLSVVAAVACGSIKAKNPDGGGDDGGGSCAASQPLRCDGKTLVSCNDAGTGETQTQCSLRCNAMTLACENQVAPSNGFAAQLDGAVGQPAVTLTPSSPVIGIDTDADFNPTAGTLKIGSQQVKAELVPGTNGMPDVIVVSVGSLTIAASGTNFVQFQGSRAVAIMSAGDVTISGTLRAFSGGFTTNNPCVGGSAAAAGADNDNPGGGGGGFAQPGGTGGAILAVATGGAAGSTSGNPELVPLRGGCKGGLPAFGGLGTGGGALQITSATRIDVSGRLHANGFGGFGPTGGGSGGGILIEALTVSITGGVFANGGAGGGCAFDGQGNDGDFSTSPALSPCGGNGGSATAPAANGTSLANTAGQQQYAGAGGGGVGRIRINTLDMTLASPGTQSPAASLGVIAGR